MLCKYYPLMYFIVYAFKGHVFARQMKILSHSSCRTRAILKYFCPLPMLNIAIATLTCTAPVYYVNGKQYSRWISDRKNCCISHSCKF